MSYAMLKMVLIVWLFDLLLSFPTGHLACRTPFSFQSYVKISYFFSCFILYLMAKEKQPVVPDILADDMFISVPSKTNKQIKMSCVW